MDGTMAEEEYFANAKSFVTNGLKLFVDNVSIPIATFDYERVPFEEQQVNVDFPITANLEGENIEDDHIRYHPLVPGDNLQQIISDCEICSAKALVLINNKDSYELESEFLVGVEKRYTIPVLLLSKSAGSRQMKIVTEHKSDQVLAEITIESEVDVKTYSVAEEQLCLAPCIPDGEHAKQGTGTYQRVKRAILPDRRLTFDIQGAMERLLSGSSQIIVSQNPEMLSSVMSTLNTGKTEPEALSDHLQKLQKHIHKVFCKDFPFYILLLYRLRQGARCDELDKLTQNFIEKMESLKGNDMADVINDFTRRGDFKISFRQEEAPKSSVFDILEAACLNMADVSFKMKKHSLKQPGLIENLHSRMMWISLALALHSKRCSPFTTSARNLWRDQVLLKFRTIIDFREETWSTLNNELEFGDSIHIHPTLTFAPDYLVGLLVSEEHCHPFQMVKNCIDKVNTFLAKKQQLHEVIVTLRSSYSTLLRRDGVVNKLSVQKTLDGALTEGLLFVDKLYELLLAHPPLRPEITDNECWLWLALLLKLIDVTGDNPISHLRMFVSSTKFEVCKQYRGMIVETVVTEIKQNFERLTVKQFCPLLKEFKKWTPKDLETYLEVCKLPPSFRIREPIWTEFLNELMKYSGDHHYILTFLKKIAKLYRQEKHAHWYLLDLVHLKVPALFAVGAGEIEGDTKDIAAEFVKFLCDYVKRIPIEQKSSILSQLHTLLDSISEEPNEFQQLVLCVIHKEVVYLPELSRTGQETKSTVNKNLYSALELAIQNLCDHLSDDLSPKLKFCWGVVASCCSNIPLSKENFKWLDLYSDFIRNFGYLFTVYSKNMGISEILPKVLPREIQNGYCFRREFFEWVIMLQGTLQRWQQKCMLHTITSDEVFLYASSNTLLCHLGDAFACESLVVEAQDLEKLSQIILKDFENLNILLLQYIPGRPDAQCCKLPSLLEDYGVLLPPEISGILSKCVQFPGESSKLTGDPLKKRLESSATGSFKPGLDISLNLTNGMHMNQLGCLVQDLQKFLEPLMENLDTLVFFKLLRSVMFDRYLRLELDKASVTIDPLQAPDSTPVLTLKKGLQCAKKLVIEIMEGTAKYDDITGEGKLLLETLDIEREFGILSDYSVHFRCSTSEHTGLHGVRSLLELKKYTTHVRNVLQVCEQYQLCKQSHLCENHELCKLYKIFEPNNVCNEHKLCDQCREGSLQELNNIFEELGSQEDCLTLTARSAIRKLHRVKRVLCIKDSKSTKSLDIFAAVRDSAELYRFIRSKGFVGPEGHGRLYDLRQLITAQLQHEDYNETVLNNLYVAFEYITPFMNKEQSLRQLMLEVTSFDVTDCDCIKQLQTVNTNITLIEHWFSRAEGETVENIGEDLHCILGTGLYCFELSDGKPEVILKYTPSVSEKDAQLAQPIKVENASDVIQQDPVPSAVQRLVVTKSKELNSEQINDFVRKLGFLDSDKTDHRDDIKYFLWLNEIARKLLKFYVRLRELGHPKYLMAKFTEELHCSVNHSEAKRKMKEAEQMLAEWTKEVSSLHNEFHWLLFFSVPKLLTLYKLLTSENPCPDSVVQEVSFLCSNNAARERVSAEVKKIIPSCLKELFEGSPMKTVGRFLHHLPLETDPYECEKQLTPSHRAVPNTVTLQLHVCHGFTHGQLMQVIVGIYNGIPEAFKVFRCHSTSTEEDLQLFVNRAKSKPLMFMILEVNKLSYQLQEILMHMNMTIRQESTPQTSALIHIVETAPSMLKEVPGILQTEYEEPLLSSEKAREVCLKKVPKEDLRIKLVYGSAGDGKTHYIKQKLASSPASVTIAVNEAFAPRTAIKKLCSLPLEQKNCAIFFNFTMLPPGGSIHSSNVVENEKVQYKELMEMIGWFFFDFVVLGYVEDRKTGLSFCMPGGLQWAIYVEVPSRNDCISTEALVRFKHEAPALALLATDHHIRPDTPYSVDEDVKLVCKYLHALKKGDKGIDRLYTEGHPVQFSQDDIKPDNCRKLLSHYMPADIYKSKITQRLFIEYMKRRCAFLDNLPSLTYNTGVGEYMSKRKHGIESTTDTRKLGSTLMNTMLHEVEDFCNPVAKKDWSIRAHKQLIYDFKDGGGSIGFITLSPDKISDADRTNFKKIGVQLPALLESYDRELLDSYLSRALNVELENGRLTPIDESNYVLTIDYTVKMLNIHERYECGVPVIIEGETGVGKTALVEMLSKLWNHSRLLAWKKQRNDLMKLIQQSIDDTDDILRLEQHSVCVQTVNAMTSDKPFKQEDLLTLCDFIEKMHSPIYAKLAKGLQSMMDDPAFPLLTFNDSQSHQRISVKSIFASWDTNETKEMAYLLYAIFTAQVKPTFHKINVHAALTPSDIASLLNPVFEQAKELKEAFDNPMQSVQKRMSVGSSATVTVPFVTVFLDEVNTSSCLGLFKEIFVDKSFNGEPIPENVFIVAACNPHRGNSTVTLADNKEEKERWMSGSYYVHSLHPTLWSLMWDYGSLSTHQERDYINAKMKMLNKQMTSAKVVTLTELIISCQNLMRKYAMEHLIQCGMPAQEVEASSHSCVSQRDIQRVFTLYQFFVSTYIKLKPFGQHDDYKRRAVLVALGVVYYMRLNNRFRKEFVECLNKEDRQPGKICFTEAFENELDWYIGKLLLPVGIACTQALKENVFATIVCSVNRIPLIIVGDPGSSKTLSFNQVIANLKGQESKIPLFRDTSIFPSLDPHYYQCSRRTTSNEVDTVFSRAVNRQHSHMKFKLPINCVVFMDEAGLPEESHESLKVLHYRLDKQEVSFVAITNYVLDAAKTNRAISLFRPEAPYEDLETLAKGCFCFQPTKLEMNTIVKFCIPYSKLMHNDNNFRKLFGLRDFIHFINYLRRMRQNHSITQQLVLEALERNFNGSQELFSKLVPLFLETMGSEKCKVFSPKKGVWNVLDPDPTLKLQLHQRGILKLLENSLEDRPQQEESFSDASPNNRDQRFENEVRYILIIDPSEDDSIVRFLFSFGILQRERTRMYVCSDFTADRDSQLQKINTIAAIRHSAIEGHTVVMSQTDDIHESFYDLFNQRFRVICDPKKGNQYYTNIAIGAHLKPCRVHPDFQCVVVLKKSEVEKTPTPFLNRFEKYFISHSTLLDTVLENMPCCIRAIIESSKAKAQEFVDCISTESLYGFKSETLDSLLLSILPFDHKHQTLDGSRIVEDHQDVKVYLMQLFMQALRYCAGFCIPQCPLDELSEDVECIFELILKDAEFDGVMEGLDHTKALQSVVEAMEILLNKSTLHDSQQLPVNPDACMVIAIFQQWLVRYLCKKLLQLMTPEALFLRRNKIPTSYIENYLVHQSHFSLKKLISNQYSTLLKDWTNCPTKLLCFTRSSPLINKLPSMYPSTVFDTQVASDAKQVLHDFVYPNSDKLMICKLSGVFSHTFIQDFLRDFASSDDIQVCLLVANMQEISKQVINHIRIMIEEVEALHHPNQKKLYVLLLHFPPAQFSDACYPSLFLKGWDHYYLDTIAHKAVKGVIDIQDWLCLCCCFDEHKHTSLESDSLMQTLRDILAQSITILTSKVNFGCEEGRSFNCPMNGAKRSQALKDLLHVEVEDVCIGDILCEKFRAYWKPSVMVEALNKSTAISCQNSEVTLSITDSVQTYFKTLFLSFLAYMLNKMNENYNIDLLFDPDCTSAVRKLFVEILRILPTPEELSEISVLDMNILTGQDLSNTPPPQFPFFKLVYNSIEHIIEESRNQTNLKMDILNGRLTGVVVQKKQDQQSTLVKIVTDVLQDTTKAKLYGPVVLATEAIKQHKELWQRYFTEFCVHKLHLHSSSDKIAQQMLDAYFGSYNTADSVVGMHAHVCINYLEVANLANILRPLDKIQAMHQQSTSSPHLLAPSLSKSLSQDLMTLMKKSVNPLESSNFVAVYVINTLFDTLIACVYPSTSQQDDSDSTLTEWYNAYREVLSLPKLKQYVYYAITSEGSSELFEARINVMHATFLILQASPTLNRDLLDLSALLFQTFFNRHFDENMKLAAMCPRLENITPDTVEIVYDARRFNPNYLTSIMERLFAHFFSAERQSYHLDDVKWFLELANKQVHWMSYSQSSSLPGDLHSEMEKVVEMQKRTGKRFKVPKRALILSLNMCKLYLGRVLGKCSDSDTSNPLLLYNNNIRLKVGEVLCATPMLGAPGPFVPNFYQGCQHINVGESSQNLRMQQPLAHLYFVTILEHLLSTQWKLAHLINTATSIQNCINEPELFQSPDSTTEKNLSDIEHGSLQTSAEGKLNESSSTADMELPDSHKVLLWIELQAVSQVVAQRVAEIVNTTKKEEVKHSVKDINRLLSMEALGGGKTNGHGMVVALHMVQLLKSTRRFSKLLTKQYETTCGGIDCLKHVQGLLKVRETVSKPQYFLSLTGGAGKELYSLYEQVKKVMVGIHNDEMQLSDLVHVAKQCDGTTALNTMFKKLRIKKERFCFIMLLWLVVYYEFFEEKIYSVRLKDAIGSHEMAQFLQNEACYVRLFQTFLCPSTSSPDTPHPLRETEEELTSDSPVRMKTQESLYQLFFSQSQDQSDMDLRDSLAILVAIVLGCPSQSNHLWYHIFAPDELTGTFLTGFMYNSQVGPDGLPYDCGVELKSDGLLGRQEYKEHANRGTYNLHSLYFLLWANFGSFCISLLTQPEAEAQLHGPIISKDVPVRHYCVSQLREMWRHMRDSLGLSEEERSFFVMKFMWSFYKTIVKEKGITQGLFKSEKLVDDYEQTWHTIYESTLTDFNNKFPQHCTQHWLNADLLKDLKLLESCYPYFNDAQDFTHSVVTHVKSSKSKGELNILSYFATEWEQLQAGGLLLPDLVEFYVWIHTNLAPVTYESARALLIGQVVEQASKQFKGDHLTSLFERVKAGYNNYLKLVGQSISAKTSISGHTTPEVTIITNNTPLLQLLSVDEEGCDGLLVVITDITKAHNGFIERLHTCRDSSLARHIPIKPATITLAEVNQHNCILGNLKSGNEFLQLIRSHYTPPELSQQGELLPSRHMRLHPMFQMTRLEEDVVINFIAGKPLIEIPGSFRIHFKFQQPPQPQLPELMSTMYLDKVDTLQLPAQFQVVLEENLRGRIEYEFHSADYNTMIAIECGLKTVVRHLAKSLINEQNVDHLECQTMSIFMIKYYDQESEKVLEQFGMSALTQRQVECLTELPMPSLWSCLQLFASWVKERFYDCSHLPLHLKSRMRHEDKEAVDNGLRKKWFGSKQQLLDELKEVKAALKHLESHASKTFTQAQEPIVKSFKQLLPLFASGNKLITILPDTILLQHYVYFKLTLNRLIVTLDQELKDEDKMEDGSKRPRWCEVVDSLWKEVLPDLRPPVTYPSTRKYGYQETTEPHMTNDEPMKPRNQSNMHENESAVQRQPLDKVHTAEEDCLDEKAAKYTSDMVAEFLQSIKMDVYVEDFLENEINGTLLLKANSEALDDFGVSEVVDRFKLPALFKRVLQTGSTQLSMAEVVHILEKNKLDQYSNAFEQNQIDVGMILEADNKLLNEVLKAIGVESAVDRLKLQVAFKKTAPGHTMLSVSNAVEVLMKNGLDRYKESFVKNEISGDMLLEAEEDLFKEALQEIGVASAVHRRKMKMHFKNYYM